MTSQNVSRETGLEVLHEETYPVTRISILRLHYFWGANAERNGGLNGSYLLRMFRVIIMTGMQLGLTLWIFQTLQTDC